MTIAPARPRGALRRLVQDRWDILLVIALGGSLGSLGRWGLGEAFPHSAHQFAWGTFIANISGALVMGFLMVVFTEIWPGVRHLRPFLGVGVLGGYTTFSTYLLDTRAMFASGSPGLAAGYLFATLFTGLVAVMIGIFVGRIATGVRR